MRLISVPVCPTQPLFSPFQEALTSPSAPTRNIIDTSERARANNWYVIGQHYCYIRASSANLQLCAKRLNVCVSDRFPRNPCPIGLAAPYLLAEAAEADRRLLADILAAEPEDRVRRHRIVATRDRRGRGSWPASRRLPDDGSESETIA